MKLFVKCCLTAVLLATVILSFAQGPVWEWAKLAGGNFDDYVGAISTDSKGFIYMAGRSQTGSVTFGDITLDEVAGFNSFLVKYDPTGNAVWGKRVSPHIRQMTIDANDHVIITGASNSISGYNFFVTKFDPDGNELWIRTASGNDFDAGMGITVDQQGNIFVSGEFRSNSMTFDSGTTLYNSLPGHEVTNFIARYTPDGNLTWARSIHGAGGYGLSALMGNRIAIDSSGNLLVAGYIALDSLVYNGTSHLYSYDLMGWNNYRLPNVFLLKIDQDSNLIWAMQWGESGREELCLDISISQSGDVNITGITTEGGNGYGKMIFSPWVSYSRTFIIRFDSLGNIRWNKEINGLDVVPGKVGVTEEGNAIVCGSFVADTIYFDDLTLKGVVSERDFWGNYRASACLFVVQYDEEGNAMWAKRACPDQLGRWLGCGGLALDENGNIFAAGYFASQSLAFDSHTLFGQSQGSGFLYSTDIFLAKIITKIIPCDIEQPTITSGEPYCENGRMKMTLTSSANQGIWWNTGETSATIIIDTSGVYAVTHTGIQCTLRSDEIEVNIEAPLQEIILKTDCYRIFTESDALLKWFKDDQLFNPPGTSAKEYSPVEPGNFYVEASNFCSTKRSNVIHFMPASPRYIFLPNIITPNGDPFNEFFTLDEKLENSAITIYNRWGEEVYHSNNYQNNWNGPNVSSGVYYYSIVHSCFPKSITGSLMVVR